MEHSGGSLCGLWVEEADRVHVTVATADGGREHRIEAFRPFSWLGDVPVEEPVAGVTVEELKGEGPFRWLARAATVAACEGFTQMVKQTEPVDSIRPWETQFLIERRARLYRELGFPQLRRCQLDIETDSADGRFSDPKRAGDRVLAIGLRCQGRNRLLLLEEESPAGERKLLEGLNAALGELDPDVIEGHNLFKFDFDYLRQRCRLHQVPCLWGRYGQPASFRNSRLKVAERMIDFPRCDLPGRAVVDTYLLVLLYDITARELTSYGLKDVAVALGITSEAAEERTYLDGNKIAATFRSDRARFTAYLEDDLRETAGLGDLLLPTYFEQARTFPILLQDATLRGTTAKIDLLFLEEYYHRRQACPAPPEVQAFEGGYTKSFREGVFRHVLHFDVASLYPSLLLQIGRNPKTDALGVFIPLLRQLRDYRLTFKQLARSSSDPEERAEAQARQSAYKILINSFYGYLGFSGARFGDGELAAEVTRRGRELLQALIDEFARRGCEILEADTDGIYLSSAEYFDRPEALLELVRPILPEGIELEYDGRYPGMFCYKAKNYALYDGEKIILRGSAFRSRGIEPYLQRLTDRMIHFLLGADADSPLPLLERYREQILKRTLPVEELAKSETLGQNPESYERFVAEGGKPRRAAAEAALQMDPRPRMGDRVSYFVTLRQKGMTSDWQRARPVSRHDPAALPYDPTYYADKLDDWLERYGPFLGVKPAGGVQGELL